MDQSGNLSSEQAVKLWDIMSGPGTAAEKMDQLFKACPEAKQLTTVEFADEVRRGAELFYTSAFWLRKQTSSAQTAWVQNQRQALWNAVWAAAFIRMAFEEKKDQAETVKRSAEIATAALTSIVLARPE